MSKDKELNENEELNRIPVRSSLACYIISISAAGVIANQLIAKTEAMKMEMVLKAIATGFFVPLVKAGCNVVSEQLLGYIYQDPDKVEIGEWCRMKKWVDSLTESEDPQYSVKQ
mgnify:CR=1 FL=1